jgi:hypothetical protein
MATTARTIGDDPPASQISLMKLALDLIEWETLQIPERRVPHAEIVKRNSDAELPKLTQGRFTDPLLWKKSASG